MGVNFTKAVFSDDVVCAAAFSVFLFLIGYFFGKDYAVFEVVARFVGQ
jgi:hypothetical protein